MELMVFGIFAALAVAGAILVIAARNPVHSALALLGTAVGVAALFVLLEAHFLAAVQVLVYAGLSLVIFLFALMTADPPAAGRRTAAGRGRVCLSVVLALILLAQLSGYLLSAGGREGEGENIVGTTAAVGRLLFTRFLLPFEVVAIILLLGLVGIVVLARRDQDQSATAALSGEE